MAIPNYLLAAGEFAPGTIEQASISDVARPQRAGLLVYPTDPPMQPDLFAG